jgi:hypothetical protein
LHSTASSLLLLSQELTGDNRKRMEKVHFMLSVKEDIDAYPVQLLHLRC